LAAAYLAARDPDDIAIYESIAEGLNDEREREGKDLAVHIAEGTRKVLGG
jgi:hypothetical protein